MREDSRIKTKLSGAKVPINILLLASIADRLGVIMACLGNIEPLNSIVDALNGTEEKQEKETVAFNTTEEFMKARYGE